MAMMEERKVDKQAGKKEAAFQRQISAAIIQLRLRTPFFATLALFAGLFPRRSSDGSDGRT